MNFKNVILVVVFNYSSCLNNKQYIYDLYSTFFKKVIFYSDTPDDKNNNDIEFIFIDKGRYTHKIFPCFYKKYYDLIQESDGVFYTMDDNIINLNILENYDPNKIITACRDSLKPLNQIPNEWHWIDHRWGKSAIIRLLLSGCINKYNINKFCGDFADWFYLPKRYWTDENMYLFEKFSEFGVFLEIAIPSIIHNIETDPNQINQIKFMCLWNDDRKKVFDFDFLKEAFVENLFVHPIKFNESDQLKLYLDNIFKKKCIIITTINPPNNIIHKYSKINKWDLIVVGDKKTPNKLYDNLKCIYLDLEKQQYLYPELYDKIPFNSYARKMFGYLYAIQNKYKIIYETDDDNLFKNDLDNYILESDSKNTKVIAKNNGFVNVYNLFTNKHIYPRGLPLNHKSIYETPALADTTNLSVSVIQGLVDNDPDVDAYYRININNDPFFFDENQSEYILEKGSISPFNTQNTFWIDPKMFYALYLPISVSFRFTDILRGYIALFQLWKSDKSIKFTYPTAIQERNIHDLEKDFEQEKEMFEKTEQLIELLDKNKEKDIIQIYKLLAEKDIVKFEELEVLELWMKYVNYSK